MFSITWNNRPLEKDWEKISKRITGDSDTIGDVCRVLHKPFSDVFMVESPSEAELVAVHKCLFICKDQGITDILIEGDSLAIVTSIHQLKALSHGT